MKLAIFALIFGAFAQANSPIIRPHPDDLSQISGFQADWCTRKLSSARAQTICFGRSRFQATKSIRSVLVKRASGADLYVEDRWPGVELLKPRFGLIGPVNQSATEVESGEAILLLNSEAMEEGIVIETPSLGTIQAVR